MCTADAAAAEPGGGRVRGIQVQISTRREWTDRAEQELIEAAYY